MFFVIWIMRPVYLVTLLLGLLAGSTAWAADAPTKGAALSLGGAAQATDSGRFTLWEGGSLAAGVSPLPRSAFGPQPSAGMQMGGFLAWQSDDYRVDATLAPSLDGSVVAGLGAVTGARPGQAGTSYGVRLGAAWSGERFTVNPASGLGLAEVVAPTTSDVNLTFTVNHSLTPSLSVIGTAEARRNVASPTEGIVGQNRFLFGAGLGYRF